MGIMGHLRQLFKDAGLSGSLLMCGYALYLAFGYMSFESSTVLSSLGEVSALAQPAFLALALCGRIAVYAIVAGIYLITRQARSAFRVAGFAAGIALAGFLLMRLTLDFSAYVPFEKAAPWLMLGGVCFGAGGALANLLWARFTGTFDLRQAYLFVTLSYTLSLVVYLGVTLLPAAATLPAGAVLLLASIAISKLCLDRREPIPEEYATPMFRGGVATLWRPVLGTAILCFMGGLMLQMPHNQDLSLAQFQSTSLVAQAIVNVALLLPALLVRSQPNLGSIYKVALPLSAAGFLLLPLVWSGGAGIANACAQLGAGVANMLLWCMVASLVHETRLPAGLMFSAALLAPSAAQLAGTVVGLLFQGQLDQGSIALTGIALVAVYLVAMVSMFLFKDRGLRGIDDGAEAASAGTGTTGAVYAGADGAGPNAPRMISGAEGVTPATGAPTSPTDTLTARCAELARRTGLTPRETELLAQLGRGLTVHAISEELTVSENTVKYHIKSIYQKLGVHSRDEVIARIEAASAEDGPA